MEKFGYSRKKIKLRRKIFPKLNSWRLKSFIYPAKPNKKMFIIILPIAT
tara:strand:+ start:2110 stop:2256 length:147 start_codon:yes stop_codon:yes gene_type:complete